MAISPILIDPSLKSYGACRDADGLLHVVDLGSEMAPKGVLVVAALACQVATAFVPVVPVSSVPACTRVSTAAPQTCPSGVQEGSQPVVPESIAGAMYP